MRNRGRLLEVLYRAETGPIIDEKEFEAKLITSTVKRLISKYDIKFDRNTIVPSDDDLADRIFRRILQCGPGSIPLQNDDDTCLPAFQAGYSSFIT